MRRLLLKAGLCRGPSVCLPDANKGVCVPCWPVCCCRFRQVNPVESLEWVAALVVRCACEHTLVWCGGAERACACRCGSSHAPLILYQIRYQDDVDDTVTRGRESGRS